MVRSGKLLVIGLSAALVVACGTTDPPAGGASPTSPPAHAAERTCPDGLAEALEQHLMTQEFGGELPVEVVVTEFPEEMGFASSLADEMSECILRTERQFSDSREFQVYGIVTHLDEAAIVDELTAAGFEQPFPDTEPGSWQRPDLTDSIGLYPDGGAERPALLFPDWAEYLDPGDVVILGTVAT